MTFPSVVQVTPRADRGGAEGIALQLATAVERAGGRSRVAVAYGSGGPNITTMPSGAASGQPARALLHLSDRLRRHDRPRAAFALRALATPGVVRDLAAGREDFRYPATRRLVELAGEPDVLHLHNLHGGYFDLAQLPAISARVPTVITLHDSWLLAGHCAHSLACERWRTGCGDCPHLDVYPRLRRDGTAANWQRKRDILARARLHVVAPSRWLLDRAGDSILAPAMIDAQVIPNGVDLDVFTPSDRDERRTELGVPETHTLVVFAANGIRRNDFKDWPTLEAAARIVGARASRPVVLGALGDDGDDVAHGALTIRFLGRRDPGHGVAAVMQAADVYVHAARAETFPTSILEALACGLPVVASDVGGIPEQVGDATGRLVPAGDPGALADALLELVEDGRRRAAMGARAAEDARARFGLERMVDAYMALYEEIAPGA